MNTTTITPVWGVTKTFTDVPGIITDWDGDDEAQTVYVQNEKGETVHTKVYDVRKTVTCTLVVALDKVSAVPSVGDKVSVDNDNYTVLSVRLTQNNQAVNKYAIKLETWSGAPSSATSEA
jgi:hypothetical protein